MFNFYLQRWVVMSLLLLLPLTNVAQQLHVSPSIGYGSVDFGGNEGSFDFFQGGLMLRFREGDDLKLGISAGANYFTGNREDQLGPFTLETTISGFNFPVLFGTDYVFDKFSVGVETGLLFFVGKIELDAGENVIIEGSSERDFNGISLLIAPKFEYQVTDVISAWASYNFIPEWGGDKELFGVSSYHGAQLGASIRIVD